MASVDELERDLAQVAQLLDTAAKTIRDQQLNSGTNIRKIGEAIALVAEVRQEIYALRPDLLPNAVRKR